MNASYIKDVDIGIYLFTIIMVFMVF